MLNRTILLLLCLVGSTINMKAQAWTRAKGSGYAQIGFNSIAGESIYNNQGPSIQLPFEVQDFTIAGYFEYGLSDKLTLSANLPFKLLQTSGTINPDAPFDVTISEGQLNSLGNLDVSLLYGIRQGKALVMSAGLKLALPTASYDDATGLRSGFDTYGIAPMFNVGYSKNKLFSSFRFGLNFRGNDYSDQLLNAIEVGKLLGDKLYLILGHEILLSMNNGNYDDANTNQTGLYANNTEFLAYSLKFGYAFNPKWIAWLYLAGGYQGNTVLKSPSISLALSYSWQ